MSVAQLEAAAAALGPLVSDVAFIGGASVGLWRTDQATRAPRITVDVIVEALTLTEYTRFQEAMRNRRFREDIDADVACRWIGPDSKLILDAVPAESRLAGIEDPWLRDAVSHAVDFALPTGVVVRAVPPPWLLVLKLQAFADRGGSDTLGSRDFEDIVVLVDGRSELLA